MCVQRYVITVQNFIDGVQWTKVNEMKDYYTMNNIGKCKYVVNFYDGIQTHKDGSKFYDIRIFKNKVRMKAFINELIAQGYKAQ